MLPGNAVCSVCILLFNGFEQADVVLIDCLCRTAAEAEDCGAVKMRGKIFHKIVPVGAAALHIEHPVELLVQRKDLFLLRTLNVHPPQGHILPQAVDVRRGQLFAGHAGDLGFQHRAEMAHFLHQFRVDQRNISADFGPDLDQPPLRQFQLCFPERCAADAKLLAQLRFIEFCTRFQPGIQITIAYSICKSLPTQNAING